MNGRRTFLAGFGFLAATLLPFEKATGGPFRRRRCTPSKIVRAVPKPAVAKTGDSFIQPDYDKWSRVKEGMTEAEVLDLLGEPLERDTEETAIAEIREEEGEITEAQAVEMLRSEMPHRAFMWLYGRLRYDSPAIPDEYEFYIHFQQKVVWGIVTPFVGNCRPMASRQRRFFSGQKRKHPSAILLDSSTCVGFRRLANTRWRMKSNSRWVSMGKGSDQEVHGCASLHWRNCPYAGMVGGN